MIDRGLDRGIRESERRRKLPWTKRDLERVRQAADALVRTHRPIDTPDNRIVAGFDGKAFWSLLGALDRVTGGDE